MKPMFVVLTVGFAAGCSLLYPIGGFGRGHDGGTWRRIWVFSS